MLTKLSKGNSPTNKYCPVLIPLQLARVVISPTSGSLSRLDLLYPYRVDDSLTNYALADTSDWNYHSGIGELIFCLDDNLKSNEVYLLGQEVLISEYPKLYELWGDTYGVASSNLYFVLPNFSNRVPWGTTTGTYGYIEAGLPNIYGHWSGTTYTAGTNAYGGCITRPVALLNQQSSSGSGMGQHNYELHASLYNPIYGNSDTVQPPAVRVLCKARYY